MFTGTAYDEDGDTVTCRFAKGESECGDICDDLPNATINEVSETKNVSNIKS